MPDQWPAFSERVFIKDEMIQIHMWSSGATHVKKNRNKLGVDGRKYFQKEVRKVSLWYYFSTLVSSEHMRSQSLMM